MHMYLMVQLEILLLTVIGIIWFGGKNWPQYNVPRLPRYPGNKADFSLGTRVPRLISAANSHHSYDWISENYNFFKNHKNWL